VNKLSYEVISLQEMDNFLRQRRFYPVDLYFRRRPVKEWVYERRLPQNANHFVRVYTTIQRYGGKTDQSRDVGKDAIRVQVIYRDDKGETLVSMPKRVNRVGTWKDNLDDRMTEIAQTLPTVTMDSRGEPMTLRKKKGSLFWGSRDYPNYKETRRYGAEQEDLSEGLLREDQYNHIDDSESLKYIYDNFVSPFLESSVSSRKGVMFGPDYREQIDNMMATFKYGFLMRGRQNNDVWLMIPIYEDNDVHDISALSVENGILVLQDSLPLSDIFDAVSGTDPFYYYEPLYRSIWKALLDMDYGMAAINYSIIGKSFAAETIQCCECQTTENITTIHAGTYCYDCLPINLGAEDNYNSKLFSSIVKDIWNRFSVMKSSRHREKYLQREINSRIRLNSGYGGQNEEANDRYFQAITISDTDLRYYIDEEWDDGSVEFNKLTQESLKRVADLQNDLRTKYNNPSIKLEVHENTTVDIEGSGVFVVEISMDANTSFDAEEGMTGDYLINILLLEWAMLTNEKYDSQTITKGLVDYIVGTPYDFVRHMQMQDLIALMPSSRALVPADFLYYLKDKDRDHWGNMNARAVSFSEYNRLKEMVLEDYFWLSDNEKNKYHAWIARSAINYQNI